MNEYVDITDVYCDKHVLDVTQQNEKEMIQTCRSCPIQFVVEIISVKKKQ